MNRQPTIDIKSSNETVVSTERPVVQGGTIIFPVNKTETGIESVSFGFLVSISSFYFGDALEGDYDVYFKAHASTVVYWDGTYNYDAKNLMNSSTSSIAAFVDNGVSSITKASYVNPQVMGDQGPTPVTVPYYIYNSSVSGFGSLFAPHSYLFINVSESVAIGSSLSPPFDPKDDVLRDSTIKGQVILSPKVSS